MSNFTVMDADLADKLVSAPQSELDSKLFLEQHPEFPNSFLVNSFDPTFMAKLENVIGKHRAVSPFKLGRLHGAAAELGYEPVYMVSPAPTLDWLASLNETPDVEINSAMTGTVKGWLPFQVQGYNFLKTLDGGYVQWSTGTGKTVLAAGLTKHHKANDDFDVCIWMVKAHNKINTQRALSALVDLDSIIVDGTQKQRDEQYAQIAAAMQAGTKPIIVTNYEKLREDKAFWKLLVENHRVMIVWDEMPTKLRNRGTALYKATAEVLYTSYATHVNKQGKQVVTYYPKQGAERASKLIQYALSATPIENSPEDVFNCVRLMAPGVYGSVKEFHARYGTERNRFNPAQIIGWRDLDHMGAKIAHLTHQVDKDDPDIASQFPAKESYNEFVDLDKADRKLYDALADEYRKMKKGALSLLSQDDILAGIQVLQMLCDNPRMVLESARRRAEYEAELAALVASGADDETIKDAEDKVRGSDVALRFVKRINDDSRFTDASTDGEPRAVKLEALRELLDGHKGKVIMFSTFNEVGLPLISEWLTKWGYKHVLYHGGLSMKAKQEAEDRFKNDPNVKVFLSTDAGSDSINLEVADLAIHFDLPWKWSTLEQRQNRIHRITSTFAKVRFVTLAVTNSVEDRKQEILDTKYGYHKAVLKGEIAAQAMELRRSDLIYILTGER